MSGHGYNRYCDGCRCEVCRGAKADYMRERRALARAVAQQNGQGRPGLPARTPGVLRHVAPITNHGTRYGYEEAGCRCFDCTDARSASDRKYYRPKSAS